MTNGSANGGIVAACANARTEHFDTRMLHAVNAGGTALLQPAERVGYGCGRVR